MISSTSPVSHSRLATDLLCLLLFFRNPLPSVSTWDFLLCFFRVAYVRLAGWQEEGEAESEMSTVIRSSRTERRDVTLVLVVVQLVDTQVRSTGSPVGLRVCQ